MASSSVAFFLAMPEDRYLNLRPGKFGSRLVPKILAHHSLPRTSDALGRFLAGANYVLFDQSCASRHCWEERQHPLYRTP